MINEKDSGFIGFCIRELGYMPGKCKTITERDREKILQELWSRYTGKPADNKNKILLNTIYS